MLKSQYDQKMKHLKYIHGQAVEKLNIEFSNSNNPNKIGDVIEDHHCRIRIERIDCYVSYISDYPDSSYTGPLLKKNNKPFKNGEHETIYQSRIKRQIPCS